MITIIVGTNRPNSRALRVALLYAELLRSQGVAHQLLDLANLPADFASTALYTHASQHESSNGLFAMTTSADKLVFVVSEYNGSFPGILKAFIDGLPYPGGIRGKKAALVGVSTGVQGGILALSHLTDILMYLGTAVLPARVRLPVIDKHLSEDGQLTNPLYQQLLQDQVSQLLAF